MATSEENPTIATGLPISAEEQHDIEQIYASLRKSRAKLVGPDGKAQRLPHSLYSFLLQLIADLKDGKSVAIMNKKAELTTAEASKILGTSRQFLVNLLESGAIPHRKVGTHRRVYMSDLLDYKAGRNNQRRKALDELSRAEADEGLYDIT